MASMIRVRAKKVEGQEYACYYLNVLRKEGDVFDILKEEHFSSRCMERVPPNTPKTFAPGEPTKEELIADGYIMPEAAAEDFREPAKRKRA